MKEKEVNLKNILINLKELKKYILNSKKTPILIAIFSFIILNVYLSLNFFEKSNYTDSFIRLHVIANSDNIDDQIQKLKVDEKVSNYLKTLNIDKNATKEEILQILKNNSSNILNVVNEELEKNEVKYSASLKIGKIKYEKKDNVLSTMPSGSYDSINIVLGKGNGKNIWSVIFPNEESIKNLSNYESILPNISNIYNNEEKIYIKSNTTNLNENDKNYSIKTVEILENIISKISNSNI